METGYSLCSNWYDHGGRAVRAAVAIPGRDSKSTREGGGLLSSLASLRLGKTLASKTQFKHQDLNGNSNVFLKSILWFESIGSF
jgi:hypothetical protein